MRHWKVLPVVLMAGVMLMQGLFSPMAQGADRKRIHLFNPDFPPMPFTAHPLPPVKSTEFWQLLDKEFQATESLALTENIEEADYRVELHCTGITYCSQLRVSIRSPQRDVLSSFTVRKIRSWVPYGAIDTALVASQLAKRLDEKINALPQGGYGYSE